MRFLVSVVLLLVQLGPVAGAGMCLHADVQPKAECSMPMQGVTHESGRPYSSSSQDCAQMVVCAPAAPMVLQGAVQLLGKSPPSHTTFSTPASLVPGDPIAPPQPPPIA